MIKISNLTKIFSSKKKYKVVALDDVNLTLPDKGLVFVVGKSGSGKSTLLNMIGALDSPTNGTIIADGNEVTKFNSHEANAYRSSYVGLVFQDYHLLNELNVEQNIRFFISKKENIGSEEVNNILTKVGLENYNTRMPNKLSGGQRQRVAIARAIIKDPQILLCDEPTGNLDKETSVQIFNILEEISKEKLVLVVTHDLNNAKKYGDRIIWLSDGKIVIDKEKESGYNNDLKIEENRLILPHAHTLSKEDIDYINENFKEGKFNSVQQNGDGYKKSKEHTIEGTPKKLNKGKMSGKNIFKLFLSFLNTKKISSIVTIIITSLLFVTYSILQSFLAFSPTETTIKKIQENNNPIVGLKKQNSYERRFNLSSITENEVKAYENTSYDDEIAKLYNLTLNTYGSTSFTIGNGGEYYETNYINKLFINETYGTVNCTEEWLKFAFGDENGNYTIVGDINPSIENGRIIITDYVADAILYNSKMFTKTYEDLLGIKSCGGSYNGIMGNICAVLSTGYKETYKNIIKIFNDYVTNPTPDTKEAYDELLTGKEIIGFIDDLSTRLGVSYCLSNDMETTLKDTSNRNFISLSNFYSQIEFKGLTTENEDSNVSTYIYESSSDSFDLAEDEVVLTTTIFNNIIGETIFDTNNINEYDGSATLTLRTYVGNNHKNQVSYEKVLKIKDIVTSKCAVSKELFPELIYQSNFAYALEFKNNDKSALEAILEESSGLGYLPIQAEASAAAGCARAVTMFQDTFNILSIMLLGIGAIFMISYGISSIFSNRYQIGVIKSLGGSTTDIGKIFVLKAFVISIITSIVSVIASIITLPFADDLLVNTFETITNREAFSLIVIATKPELLAANVIAVIAMFAVSALIALISLRRIKPANIIKARE